ncbi:MAG: hypothetical protein H6Q66_2843 [Firmicutes bacterium]|nr:hypothetical protein [Bacillota bacterium]
MHYKYNDNELKQLLKSMVILVDTREQKNKHITDWLDKNKIHHKSRKLDYGDYSYMLPICSELGIMRDLFTDGLAIERKGSLDELAANLTHERVRFQSELLRSTSAKMYLLIENGSWQSIYNGAYKSEYKPQSFVASLKCFEARYGLNIDFTLEAYAGSWIYNTCYYHLREFLIKGGVTA